MSTVIKLEGEGGLGLNDPAIKRRTFLRLPLVGGVSSALLLYAIYIYIYIYSTTFFILKLRKVPFLLKVFLHILFQEYFEGLTICNI